MPIIQINIRSLRNKLSYIHKLIDLYSPLIISCCETWLTPDIPNAQIRIIGYNILRNDRAIFDHERNCYFRGGGIVCYVNESLSSRIICSSLNSNLDEIEYLIFEIQESNLFNTLILSGYRRPSGNSLDVLGNQLSRLSQLYKNIILVGDFNRNILSSDKSDLTNIIDEESFYATPFGITHSNKYRDQNNSLQTSHTSIDVIIVDSKEKIKSFDKLFWPDMSDHYILFLKYKILKPEQSQRTIKYRCFRNCDFNALSTDLAIKLSNIRSDDVCTTNMNEKVNSFYTTMNDCLDKFAPYKVKVFKKPSAPWITSELQFKLK